MIEREVHGQRLIHGDTFDGMATIQDGSVDMILCDLPYGTTDNDWDACIDHERMWGEYWRVCKSNAAIVLTAQQPFATDLINGGRKQFRYEWIWEKHTAAGFVNAARMPLRAHENVLVFYRELPTYNPQKTYGHSNYAKTPSNNKMSNYRVKKRVESSVTDGSRFPRSVQKIERPQYRTGEGHPTQKPVALFAYLIQTYTNPGEVIMDNTAGAMTTAVAARMVGRKSICIEREEQYFEMGLARIDKAQGELF